MIVLRHDEWSSERTMLSALDKALRIKAAVALALVYASCILAPSAAFAVAAPDAAAHCLTEPLGAAHVHREHAAPKSHVHAEVTHTHHETRAPQKSSDADGKAHGGNCCGLFCVTALAHEPVPALSAPPAVTLLGAGHDYRLAGRGPDRINRPPIA